MKWKQLDIFYLKKKKGEKTDKKPDLLNEAEEWTELFPASVPWKIQVPSLFCFNTKFKLLLLRNPLTEIIGQKFLQNIWASVKQLFKTIQRINIRTDSVSQ